MSNINTKIIISLLIIILFGYNLVPKINGEGEQKEENLFVNEKVDITIVKDSYPQIVPAEIGIEPKLWKDRSLDNYSADPNNISPLNTKKYDGVIHIQSIYDREFTFGDFLNVWGFDENKIINVSSDNDENITTDFENLELYDGQKIKLVMKKENISSEKFKEYDDTKITFQYPTEWYLNISKDTINSHKFDEYLTSNNTSDYILDLYPKEFQYMNTPYFYIQIKKLDSNKMDLNEYYKKNIYKLLEANVNKIPRFINYTEFYLNNTLAYQIFLNTSLIAEAGSKDDGNSINQTSFHIWTINDGYFYDFSFKAFESAYKEYYPIINKIIESIHIK